MNGLAIDRIGPDQLDLVEPLWNALREHHAKVAPNFGQPRSRTESWELRRGQYEEWLSEPGSFILLASCRGEPAGYAMVHLRAGSPTWPLGERAGEIETLSVLPEQRSNGVGTALIEAVREELRRLEITELSLHVIPTNHNTIRFYERHGFTPFATWMRADGSGADGSGADGSI